MFDLTQFTLADMTECGAALRKLGDGGHGLEEVAVIRPDPAVLLDLAQRTYNVFHVAEARDSPYVPAQDDFVVPHGIRSVLGFGGVLPDGCLFAVTLFARVPIPRVTADFFRTLALSAKLAVLPFVGEPLFAESTAVG